MEYKTVIMDNPGSTFGEELTKLSKEGWKLKSTEIIKVDGGFQTIDRWCAVLERKNQNKDEYFDMIHGLYTDLCDRIPYAEEADDILESVRKYIYSLENEKKFLMDHKPLGINVFAHELLKEKDILDEKLKEVYEMIGDYVADELFSHSYAMEELETALKEYSEKPKSISKHHTYELANELSTREGVKNCMSDPDKKFNLIYNKTEHGGTQTGGEGPAKILIVTDQVVN